MATETLYFGENIDGASRVICAGSPKSNFLARAHLPSMVLDDAGQHFEDWTLLGRDKVQYVYGEDRIAPKIDVISMMEGGVPVPKTQKAVWHNTQSGLVRWQPEKYAPRRELATDFLLVSRLPFTSQNGDILIFAGAHGAATESVRLLLQDLEVLEALAKVIGHARYYQFVIEVPDVEHKPGVGTKPTRIRISRDLPPVVLSSLSPADLREPTADHWTAWQ